MVSLSKMLRASQGLVNSLAPDDKLPLVFQLRTADVEKCPLLLLDVGVSNESRNIATYVSILDSTKVLTGAP
ncbi:unnamed protein product [Caenorhabditis nigoni]